MKVKPCTVEEVITQQTLQHHRTLPLTTDAVQGFQVINASSSLIFQAQFHHGRQFSVAFLHSTPSIPICNLSITNRKEVEKKAQNKFIA